MADDGNDILMRMVRDNGDPLYAECQTEVDTDMDDFVSDYFNGEFFEIKDFSLSMKLNEKDPSRNALDAQRGTGQHYAQPGALGQPGVAGGHGRHGTPTQALQATAKPAAAGVFMDWKRAQAGEMADKKFPVTMEEINVTRDYDKASPILFRMCCDSVAFASASMVKRKVVGSNMLRGFIRLEFTELLVTHVGWQNGETLQEKFKFKFREVKVRYRATTLRRGSTEAVLDELPTVGWKFDAKLAGGTG